MSDLIGALVGDEPAGVGIARVAARRLAALPDPGCGRPLAQVLEPFGVLLELALGVGEQDRAHVAAARGRRVDALADDHDPAARLLDAVPGGELLAHASPEPGQIGHDDAGVAALLDALHGFTQ